MNIKVVGGVDKTTTTVNLAHAVAMMGHKVSAIDFVPQGYLMAYPGISDICQLFLKNDKGAEGYFNLASNRIHARYM